MLKILYINAITTEAAGEILKQGLLDGLRQAQAAADQGVTLDSYDIFYGARRYPRLMGAWARDHDYDAIVLSGSEKNTTDESDPWVREYLQGLRDLLDVRAGGLDEWDGPPVPVLGICFGHQALACALGGETARIGPRAGGEKVQALPQAITHPMFKTLIARADRKLSETQLKVIVLHADQVIRLPRGFHALFTSDYCAVQGMAHDRWPIVALQSHPEMNATIQRQSPDRETWDKIPVSHFEENDGPKILGAFLDWVARRR